MHLRATWPHEYRFIPYLCFIFILIDNFSFFWVFNFQPIPSQVLPLNVLILELFFFSPLNFKLPCVSCLFSRREISLLLAKKNTIKIFRKKVCKWPDDNVCFSGLAFSGHRKMQSSFSHDSINHFNI